ncbi:MAG: Crp/Fnr family transcriptional regulator [Ideonella sp.]|nr:Crp/Fnr family transcriptional regulator [Ideonella sp.]
MPPLPDTPSAEALQALLPPELARHCTPAHYPAGAHLFVAGQKPQWMFYVLQGEVVLERHGQRGQALALQRSSSGLVGEASLTSARYHCDARSTLPTVVSKIPVTALHASLQSDPAFALRWIGMLSQEVRRLRLQSERLALPTVQERLLHLIETEGASGRYALVGTLKDLARALAVSQEALYRTLARLEAEGRVVRHAGALKLC